MTPEEAKRYVEEIEDMRKCIKRLEMTLTLDGKDIRDISKHLRRGERSDILERLKEDARQNRTIIQRIKKELKKRAHIIQSIPDDISREALTLYTRESNLPAGKRTKTALINYEVTVK